MKCVNCYVCADELTLLKNENLGKIEIVTARKNARETERGTETERNTDVEVVLHKPEIDVRTTLAVYIGCILFQYLTKVDLSRFVRRDRSSPVKKNTEIFMVVVGVVILLSSSQSAADHALLKVNKPHRRQATQMGVAKPDFSQMSWRRSDLIKNVERFARIDLDQSRFSKRMQPVI